MSDASNTLSKTGIDRLSLKFCFVLFSTIMCPLPAYAESAEPYKSLNRFGDAMDAVRLQHVDEIDDSAVIDDAIRGALQQLGTDSGYATRADFEEMLRVQEQEATSNDPNKRGNIGVKFGNSENHRELMVVRTTPGMPANVAGLRPGDRVSHINSQSTEGMSIERAQDLVRGEPSTSVVLSIRRQFPFDLTVYRMAFSLDPREIEVIDNCIYIRPTFFDETLIDWLTAGIAETKSTIDNPRGYVLDLRDNPGGLMTTVADFADAFLDKGEIVVSRGREEDDVERFRATPGDILRGEKLVVIVNEGTASGAEVVASSLQHYDRATVVGARTRGYGTLHTIIPVGSGSGALRLATSRLYSPSGLGLDKSGVVPDEEVRQSRNGDDQLSRAIEIARE